MSKKARLLLVILAVVFVSGGVLANINLEEKLARVTGILTTGEFSALITRLETTTTGLVTLPPVDMGGNGIDFPTSFLAGSPAHILALGALYLRAGQEDKAEAQFNRLMTLGIASYRGFLWEEDGFNNRSLQPVLGSLGRYYLYRKRIDRALAAVERIFALQQELNRTAQRDNGRLDVFSPMALQTGVLYIRDREVPSEEVVDFLTFAGIVYQRNNRMNQALPLYERAVEVQLDTIINAKNAAPGRSSDFYYLIQAYTQAGRTKDIERLKPVYDILRDREKQANAARVRDEQARQALVAHENQKAALYRRYPGYMAVADEAVNLIDQANKSKDAARRDVLLAEAQARLLAVIVQQNCELMEQNRAILEELKKK